MIDDEVWKPIENFSKYAVSTHGRIKNIKNNKIFTLNQKNGYISKKIIGDDGNAKNFVLHRLIAMTFIPNPENKKEVNHKDKNIKNNRVDNLEWCTRSENILHANSTSPLPKKVRDSIKISEEEKKEQQFMQIKGFSNYKINRGGILIGKDDKIMVKKLDKSGYYRTKIISDDKKPIQKSIHKLVATTFIPNPNNKEYILHKNGNKEDNSVENLEWCTKQELNQFYENNGLKNKYQGRAIYKLELDGSIIEKTYMKDQESSFSNISIVCKNYNDNTTTITTSRGFGYCWVESYTEKRINPSLLRVFPDVDTTDEKIDYNKLRPYVINGTAPIWQLDLDGTRIHLWNTVPEINILDIDGNEVEKINDNNSLYQSINTGDTFKGYCWRYATYKDICYPDLPYEKIPSNYIKSIPNPENRKIDLEFLRTCIKGQLSHPVWQINKNGIRIKKWSSVTEARNAFNIGRTIIDNVCNGKSILANDYIWENASFFEDDNNKEGTYKVLSYDDRTVLKQSVAHLKSIKQYKDGVFIKLWKNPKQITEELGFSLALSYKTQNGFEFIPTTEKFKLNKRFIIKMDTKGNILEKYDNTLQEVADIIGVMRTSLGNCLNGHTKSCNGFMWVYEDKTQT
jgi:hypothetical protein